MTQIAKFILLAVLVPLISPGDDIEEVENHPSAIEHDILKGIVGLLDIVGLYILFTSKRLLYVMSDIDIKILSIGLGWAAADIVTSNIIDIIG